MKLFISADIEGCAGVALTDETHKKESVYQRFAEEMTEEICRRAKELIPGITTVETKRGVGAATWCKAKEKVISEIREGVKKAVTGQKKECQVALPEHFTYEVTYKDWKKAYTMSFYPGMQKVDTFTNKLETDRWMDIVTAHCFVVY